MSRVAAWARRAAAGLAVAALLAAGCADPARERFAKAERAFLDQKMEAALAGYRSIPRDFPESRYAPAALLRQGDLFSSFYRNYPAALEAYESLVFNYPGAEEVPTAWLRRGEVLLQQYYDHSGAVQALERIRKLYPGFAKMDEALLLLAKAYARTPDPARETAALSELIEKFPSSPHVAEGRWMLAYGYLAQQRLADADREFRKLLYLATDPMAVARAHWGLGQALEGKGEIKAALEQYEAIRDTWEDPAYVAHKIDRLNAQLKKKQG